MREEREALPRRRRRTAHDASPSEPYTVVAVRSLMARPPSPSATSSRRTPVSRRHPGRPCTAPWSRSCHRSYPLDRCPWPDKSLLRRWMDVQNDLPGRAHVGRGRRPRARRSVVPRPVTDGAVAGQRQRVVRRILATGLPRRLGENRLVAPDAAMPDGPEFRGFPAQNRCRQVGPGTTVALDGLHEPDGPRRPQGVQPRVVEPGTVARRNQRGIGRHRPDDAVAVAAGPIFIGTQGESCLEPQRIEDTHQVVGVGGTGEPAVG